MTDDTRPTVAECLRDAAEAVLRGVLAAAGVGYWDVSSPPLPPDAARAEAARLRAALREIGRRAEYVPPGEPAPWMSEIGGMVREVLGKDS